MNKLDKVIKGLECCVNREELRCIVECPYYTDELHYAHECWIPLNRDALALLKAQEPRVMTLSEMNDMRGRGKAVYYEDRDASGKSQDVFVLIKELDAIWLKGETYTLAPKMSAMGKNWRCWTSRPDEKVRAETPWQ